MVALKSAVFFFGPAAKSLVRDGVLGDGLGSLRDGVFAQLAREEETDNSLDYTRLTGP